MIKTILTSSAALCGIACGMIAYSQIDDSGLTEERAGAASAQTSSSFVPRRAEGLNLLPSARLSDWVTYGDHVVKAKLRSARDLPASEDDIASGEGYIPRQATFDVLDVVWSRAGAPEAPRRFDLGVDGWVFDEESKVPLRMEGQPPLETVGSEYLIVLTRLEMSKFTSVPGWTNLSADTILPVVNQRIATVQKGLPAGSTSQALVVVEGESIDRVASLLRTTEVDPNAVPFMDEPPDERAQSAKRASRAVGDIERDPAER